MAGAWAGPSAGGHRSVRLEKTRLEAQPPVIHMGAVRKAPWIAGIVVAVAAASVLLTRPVTAQETPTPTPTPGGPAPIGLQETTTVPGTAILPGSGPFLGPWTTGYSFFPTGRAQGPLVLIPSVAITEEFNDNIFLDNSRRESDFITSITPSIRLVSQSPTYRLMAGYSFTADKYAKHSEFDSVFRRHDFFAEGFWRLAPTLTLTVTDSLTFSNNTNVVSTTAVSTGRDEALSNSLSGGVIWQVSPTNVLQSRATWTTQHFKSADSHDSDGYSIATDFIHAFTPRLSGSIGYEFFYQTVQDEESSTTHTPRIGATYRFTRTLTGSVTGGVSITSKGGQTDTSPSVHASLIQLLKLGSASVSYDQNVGTSGGVGGTTNNQTATGTLVLDRLFRNFTLAFSATYVRSEDLGNDSSRIDLQTYQLGIRAAYAFTPWMYGLVGYNWYKQTSDSAADVRAADVDQNRVFVGLQFSYPINIKRE